jgi:hypothetical protein
MASKASDKFAAHSRANSVSGSTCCPLESDSLPVSATSSQLCRGGLGLLSQIYCYQNLHSHNKRSD